VKASRDAGVGWCRLATQLNVTTPAFRHVGWGMLLICVAFGPLSHGEARGTIDTPSTYDTVYVPMSADPRSMLVRSSTMGGICGEELRVR